MNKQKGLTFVHGYGLNVPDSVQSEAERLKELVVKNCVGPYEDSGLTFFLSLVVEGKTGVPFNFYGIRSYPIKNEAVCVDIRVKKSEWNIPLNSYRQFLWHNFQKAVWICVAKLKKRKIAVDEEKLRSHLALVETEFLGEDLKSGALDSAATVEAMPVDQYAKDEKHRVVVQYRIEGHGSETDHDKRVEVENILGEFLESGDLGYCDGGDIGSGTMNIFCFVKPEKKAAQVIIETLRKNDRLEGAVIVETVKGEEKVVWPPDFAGEFSVQ